MASFVHRLGTVAFIVLHACGDGDVRAPEVDHEADTQALETVELAPVAATSSLPAPVDPYAAFFDSDVVQSIELAVAPEEWQALVEHMRDYAAIDSRLRTGRYFRATFIYHGPAGDVTLPDVGFRTRGNTTRVIPEDEFGVQHRAHWKLDFNRAFDEPAGSPEGEIRSQRRFATLRALNLKWADDDDDPSKIRERYAYELMRRAGVPAPCATAVHLTITVGDKPVDFGLYTAIEDIDKSFLTRHFGRDDDGDLYKCLWVGEGPATLQAITNPRAIGIKDWITNYRPAYDLQSNEDSSKHERLLALIEALDTLDGEALATWLDAHFEVDLFLRALAMNVLVGMPDDYWAMGNNYYLYFAGSGRGIFLPYDYDHGLGGGWCGTPAWSCDGIATADVHVWKNLDAAFGVSNARHPLADKVLAIARYRAAYDAHLLAFIGPTGPFSRADYEAHFDHWQALYAPWLDNDLDEGETMIDAPSTGPWIDTKVESVRAQLMLR